MKLLRALHADPSLSQRALARELDISLGKVNYCLRALIEKGWVKAGNFSRSPAKHRYIYQLTPQGIAAKILITRRYLKRKLVERDALLDEIERLKSEVDAAGEKV
ncbi:MarR family EPS-associated transcriptional regulator [Wenzhouxiangella marina]|uniref:MarR family EPS-associated transcriptional regulator n=1 Tax=Wenzhouxiangella marina TaxID=1579979 RepID=UPI0021A6E8B8|nr:MarR family EPS-associated transcriptional regulator [Wenzhouxiangella marina]